MTKYAIEFKANDEWYRAEEPLFDSMTAAALAMLVAGYDDLGSDVRIAPVEAK